MDKGLPARTGVNSTEATALKKKVTLPFAAAINCHYLLN